MSDLDSTDNLKSAGSWSNYDLQAFNISIVPTDLTTFFGVQELPDSPFAHGMVLIFDYEPNNTENLSEDDAGFFFYLSVVENALPVDVETAVDDFAAFLLRFFGFSSRDQFIRRRPMLPFEIQKKRVDARVNVAVVNGSNCFLLLLVQEDKVGILHLFILTSDSNSCSSNDPSQHWKRALKHN